MAKKKNKKDAKDEKEINIYDKLAEARKIIRNSDLEKKGVNEYSDYKYYTPEQVEELVAKACEETRTICLCNLKVDDHGYYQTLDFISIDDPEKRLDFELRTRKGEITATSETQQMGGTDTYSERYIKMKVFQIKDNTLDPDSKDNRPEKEGKSKGKKGRNIDDELDNL